jgi:hypothetical protein
LRAETTAISEAAKKPLISQHLFCTFGVILGNLSDALLSNLVIMGDDESIAAPLDELLEAGLDELLLTLIPVGDETMLRTRLFHLVGQL